MATGWNDPAFFITDLKFLSNVKGWFAPDLVKDQILGHA
jgi:hypothetical protein